MRADAGAMSDSERAARDKLALCARALHRIGVYDLAGHISLRIPESDRILITPGGGLDKAQLTGTDMVTIDAAGNRLAGRYPPPLETPIHTVVHAARPELESVAHLHAHWSTVFSILAGSLDIVLLPASTLGGPVPAFDEPRLITDDQLAQKLNAALGNAAAILMRWHGITVVGDSLEEMFERAYFMEENARLLWEASQISAPLLVPPDGIAGMRRTQASVRSGARTFNYFANLERSASEQMHHSPGSSTPER
jgi:ribulose-5-phosphate 4-epimerase/fuculose-1-phosphate aldolase